MKIRFLIFDIYGMGGTVRTVLNTANYLADHGEDVEIISVFRKNKEPFFYIHPRIRIRVLRNSIAKGGGGKASLKQRIFNRLRIPKKSRLIHRDDEAYHAFSLMSDIKMYRCLKSIHDGILITTRPSFNLMAAKYVDPHVCRIGQEHLNYDIHPPGLQQAIRKLYPKLDYLITLTDEDTQTYRRLFADTGLDIRKITNSAPQVVCPVSPLDQKTVIAAGRLVPQKGFDLLIEAFALVVERFPDWRLKIYGYGRDKDLLQQMILDKHLYNHVILMGPSRDMQQELGQSSIYALSSRYEGFGMVLVEAMQCGVPVVSFDCPKGPGEIVTHGEDGLLVENGNVEQFAHALMELMGDEEKRRRFGQNALRNVQRFSIEQIGPLWLQLFEEIRGSV
ncbi:MAG: glycosyltransferase family 4 protein [Alicyclobacillus herbarius]|uniref:glycosyltransferase family 4 protein n=1 Tax=Alicyclobacillus herbarius TaxID=122960 RepID=UPI0023540C44|nr:glycosyltransferase family 4 protein [Alicyclobacillus herbarius]MCL6632479.1 glycosyltransferase family 4 protein [Alicyclobacillus herbarius]